MDLLNEVRFAFRSLRRSPGFSLAAIAALTLALGANTTVFSVVKALLSFPIPISEPESAAFLYSDNPERNLIQGPMSTDDFLEIRQATQSSFDGLSAVLLRTYNVLGAGDPVRVQAAPVTPGFFKITRQSLTLGRGFFDEEGTAGQDRATVLGYGFWQQHFGGDRSILGKTIRLDGESYEIVGVAEEGFFFPTQRTELWTPLVLEPGKSSRDQRALFGIGRLRDGVDSKTASAQVATVAERLAAEYPDTNRGFTGHVETLPESYFQGVSFAVALLYSAITLVLLIACANVANLLLARSLGRERELALRSSLGAGRTRLVRQLLIEAVTLSMVSGALGLVLAFWGVRLLRNWIAPDPTVGFIADHLALDPAVILHLLVIVGLAGLLFGILPAFQVTRGNLGLSLREGGRGGSAGPRRAWLRNSLVASEVALALALLLAAGALMRAFTSVYAAYPGFEPTGLLLVDLNLPARDYDEPDERTRFFEQAVASLSQLPGVEGASAATSLPLTTPPGPGTARVEAEGQISDVRDTTPNALDIVVAPGYFELMKIELTRGRTFTAVDRQGSAPVALVTESMVDRYWPGEDPLGRRLRLERPGPSARPATEDDWVTIVGVVGNVESHAHSLRNPTRLPQVFLPLAQEPRAGMTVVVRAERGDPLALADAIRREIWKLDATLPIDDARTMEQAITEIDTQNTFFLRILGGLSLIALLLAAIGIYSVIAYSVTRRTQEIGIRSALGAKPADTVRLVARQAAWLTGVGVVVGGALGFFLVRFLGSQLVAVGEAGADGPMTFVLVAGFFLLVAIVASLVPAGRAVRIDPVTALRDEGGA